MSRISSMINVEALPATRDFPPDRMRCRHWMFSQFHKISAQFAFEEYDTPILESEELLSVRDYAFGEQLVRFKDRSENLVMLRPEMTPSLARLILHQGKALLMPIKWYSVPQIWNASKGSKREQYQWNMDIWGIKFMTAEAELLSAMTQLFKSVGLTSGDISIRVSNRKIIESFLKELDFSSPSCTSSLWSVLYHHKQQSREVIVEKLEGLGIPATVGNQIVSALSMNMQELEVLLGEERAALEELNTLFTLASGYGFRDWLVFDASVTREISYYTGIVFEVCINDNSGLTIGGGGRYDKILTKLGSSYDIPACGFGVNDAELLNVLLEKQLVPKNVLQRTVDDLVIPSDESMRQNVCKLVASLRNQGRIVDAYLFVTDSTEQWFSYAEYVGARRVFIVSEDDWENGYVTIKHMVHNHSAQYETVSLSELLYY